MKHGVVSYFCPKTQRFWDIGLVSINPAYGHWRSPALTPIDPPPTTSY